MDKRENILNRKTIYATVILMMLLFLAVCISPAVRVGADELVSGEWYYEILSNNTVRVIKYTGAGDANGAISVPSKIAGKKVTVIGGRISCSNEGTFTDNEYITKVTIPSSVTEIEKGAFRNCTALKTVSGLNNVQVIGNEAFSGCTLLASANVSKATSIGEYAFNGCTSLQSVTLNSKLTSIASHTFNGCTKLGNVSLPSSLTSIGGYAFADCETITSVTIPGKVTEVGKYAYESCGSLSKVVIGNGVTTIGNKAFANEDKLSSVTIGSKVRTIENQAFYGNPCLTSITIPASVRTLGEEAIANCVSLKTVNLNMGLITIESKVFSGDTSLEKLIIPNTVTKLGWRCIYGCTSLKLFRIPYSVTSMDGTDYEDVVEVQVYSGSYAESYLSDKGKTYTLLATVPATSFKAAKNTIYMTVGDMTKIGYTLSPSGTTDAITWKSSYDEAASVNEVGEVTAKKKGTATILATTTTGKTIRVKIVVSNAPTSISFSTAKKTVYVGKTYTQKATVKDIEGVRKDIAPNYTSSNKSVATVNSTTGKVTAKKAGKTTITAKTGNLTAKYTIVVVKKMSKPKVSKSGKTLTVKTVAGATVTVKAKKAILGKSSKKVTANKKGVAKIKFKKKIKGVSIQITVKKSGYSTAKKTVKYK